MPNRKVLPVAVKTAKKRQVLSSEFVWKSNCPIMIVSYYPKPNKNVLLASTAHGEPGVVEVTSKNLSLLTVITVRDLAGYCESNDV